ncbi:MAG: NAD-dependent epimerase/dehydratase family protein [Planctomycetes bacterium]|nr:NAD-dependent epimerase/dehydratase family protein [Planctomycetota bacterium]
MRPLCFVTGATGFLGRHLVPALAARFRLRLLVRPGQRLDDLPGDDHELLPGRLGEQATMASGVRDADCVVHLAALVSFRPRDRAAMHDVNVAATAQLAAAAREAGVRRFLHTSTISAVACRDRPEAVDETATYNFGPLHIGYCDTKFAAEQAVLAEVARGLDAVIVNPPSMYGAGDRRKGDGSLLTSVVSGQLRWAPPGGVNVASVQSVCRGMLQALDRGRSGERYILGGENLTGSQLLQRIAQLAGRPAPRHVLPRMLVQLAAGARRLQELSFGTDSPLTSEILKLATRFVFVSSAKAEHELGYRCETVDDGIRAALAELAAENPR